MQLVTVGDMAGFGRQRRRDERGAEVAATRKTGTRVSTSHAGWFAALHICAERHAYSSGAALLRAWPFSFLFCRIANRPLGCGGAGKRRGRRSAPQPKVHIYSCTGGQPRSMRVAAAGSLQSQECSIPGGTHLSTMTIKEPYSRTLHVGQGFYGPYQKRYSLAS